MQLCLTVFAKLTELNVQTAVECRQHVSAIISVQEPLVPCSEEIVGCLPALDSFHEKNSCRRGLLFSCWRVWLKPRCHYEVSSRRPTKVTPPNTTPCAVIISISHIGKEPHQSVPVNGSEPVTLGKWTWLPSATSSPDISNLNILRIFKLKFFNYLNLRNYFSIPINSKEHWLAFFVL